VLQNLAIRDVVLIEKLDLAFHGGLCVLTGETGAGKSIILDSLGLALGARADVSLVRRGCDKGSVTAFFDLATDHAALQFLHQQDIDVEGRELILRRVISADGKSRAYINDQPVSVGLLRQLGALLIEVHGQHDERGLLNATGHRALLDAFGGLSNELAAVRDHHAKWRDMSAQLAAESARLDAIRAEEDYDRHALEELEAIGPIDGEENELAGERSMMMQGEKASHDLQEILELAGAEDGPEVSLRRILRKLERLNEKLGGQMDGIIDQFARATAEADDGLRALDALTRSLDFDPKRLEEIEERLFALRALARKHRVNVDDLPGLLAELQAKMQALSVGDGMLKDLKAAVKAASDEYGAAVLVLGKARRAAGQTLSKGVMAELAPLKLENARFEVAVQALERDDWGEHGGDRVEFTISTNKDTAPGPLAKIASGGELSRFILALKVVLASAGSAPTLIFDEVDRGIGGATASAVGTRLAELSRAAQVLVVTHSPQVAALGAHHWRITKFEVENDGDIRTITKVSPLTADERREEIARMLAGSAITEEARAAADQLMKAG